MLTSVIAVFARQAKIRNLNTGPASLQELVHNGQSSTVPWPAGATIVVLHLLIKVVVKGY